jgi:hypothetical protein
MPTLRVERLPFTHPSFSDIGNFGSDAAGTEKKSRGLLTSPEKPVECRCYHKDGESE